MWLLVSDRDTSFSMRWIYQLSLPRRYGSLMEDPEVSMSTKSSCLESLVLRAGTCPSSGGQSDL